MDEGGGTQIVLHVLSEHELSSFSVQPVILANVAIGLVLLVFAAHLYISQKSSQQADGAAAKGDSSSGAFADRLGRHVARVGGFAIFAFKLVRCAALATLLALVIISSVRTGWTNVSIVLAEVVAIGTVFAVLNVLVSAETSQVLSLYTTLFSFAAFTCYAYRDIWPLLTFTLHPLDGAEGDILWVKLALAAWAGFLGPLLEPFPYIPLHPKRSGNVPNPEQTVSIFTWIFYTFLDPIIWRAYRAPHLPHDQLPPLADYDEAEYLIKESFRHVDPFSGAKKGSLLWPILKIIRVAAIQQTVSLTFMSFLRLAGPLGVNRLLNYLEHGREGTLVQPWVWILWIAIGPIIQTLSKEMYIFFSTRSLVRVEAILTALIFDHALRLRIKADTESATGPGSSLNGNNNGTSGSQSPGQAKQGAKAQNITGKIMNHATSDLKNILDGRNFLLLAVAVPVEVIVSMVFLYVLLGWSAFVGLAVMIVLLPVPGRITALMSGAQKEKMKATDSRVQLVTEMLGVLRMVKLLGWEKRVEEEVAVKREEELKWIWKTMLYSFVTFSVGHVIPLLHMLATYAAYTILMKESLTASIVFSSLTVFDNMRTQLYWVSQILPPVVGSYVSMSRLRDFLWDTELLDSFEEKSADSSVIASSSHEHDVGFGSSEFTWTANVKSDTSSQQPSRLRFVDDVVFKRGHFNLIIGPTGSGKTSVLMALLGEMHRIPLSSESWVNLPRNDGIAYAAQESWVLSDTVKENILFGSLYEEERYKNVINQCALTKDLALFDAGDETQVGEKGITLSGGQKARITLARAVYSSAQVVLLDDVLAALDAHTSRWVVDKCFKGELMKDRTIILVTHNVSLAAPLAKFILSLNADGSNHSKGPPVDVLGKDPAFAEVAEHDSEAVELDENADKAGEASTVDPSKGKLVVAEEIALGRVGRSSYKLYLSSVGGIFYWFQYLGAKSITTTSNVLMIWWLGWWASQYALRDPKDVSAPYYLGVYSLILVVQVASNLTKSLVNALGSIRASRIVHERLMVSVFGSTFRWLDVTPTSRIITRCTQDVQAVDGAVPQSLDIILGMTILIFARLLALVVYAPVFLVPSIVVISLGLWLGNIYIKAQLSIKRDMSNCKAPVLATFGSAIHGLVSIRAYAAQGSFRKQLLSQVNEYTRAGRTFWLLNRWIAVRLDVLSAVFSASVAAYLVYFSTIGPSGVGFALVMAVTFTEFVLGLVHWINQLEVNANSLERLDQYIHIPQEPKAGVQPPAFWPASGSLSVQGLSASYTPDGPKILQDLNFEIKSGDRVGIVGRTGAGKSSLTLALLRCIHTEGRVIFDGIPTDTITLDALRSNITIIPQAPELMGGSLRHNLDPFNKYDDAILNDALRSAGLFSLQEGLDEKRITLDTKIAGGGANLSVGQRQIIALARAIVRQSKLLILDEATSAIDYETDAVIQQSLRKELRRDVTVITVAHRLQTIMDYDKIMVLDAGSLVEFDTPRALMQNQNGLLYALVEQSADKEMLYKTANFM
ncbi:ATP-binding cassette transporter [Phanerochaete sordida]|uniref:ATP-binding cassette transporter n=1 Tax=Phanerochaete sordida TaxID=48140 RepID=A0A9P3LMB4_9APHY|nr:ATP-binding cassette transporter [Phanerochaete sordida]